MVKSTASPEGSTLKKSKSSTWVAQFFSEKAQCKPSFIIVKYPNDQSSFGAEHFHRPHQY